VRNLSDVIDVGKVERPPLMKGKQMVATLARK
jgi:hypothetical protein